jgi:NAD(P)H-flavin reductase
VVELDRGYDQVEGEAEGVEEVEELEDEELVVMMARVEEVELVEVRPGQFVMVGLHEVMVTVCVMVDVDVVVSSC